MNLIEVLKQSHQALNELGQKLLHSPTPQQQNECFNQLWQQFFAHEQAEESIALKVMRGKKVDEGISEQALKYAVDEHHYFERFIEDIVAISFDDERRKVLIGDLIAQLQKHMQYEEEFIFPQMAQFLTQDVQQSLADEYLQKLKEVKLLTPKNQIV